MPLPLWTLPMCLTKGHNRCGNHSMNSEEHTQIQERLYHAKVHMHSMGFASQTLPIVEKGDERLYGGETELFQSLFANLKISQQTQYLTICEATQSCSKKDCESHPKEGKKKLYPKQVVYLHNPAESRCQCKHGIWKLSHTYCTSYGHICQSKHECGHDASST